MTRTDARRGMVVGDALLVLAVLALGFALAYPRIRRTAFREHVEQAVTHVQDVVDAAARFREVQDRWPDRAPAGEIPAGLAEYLPPDFSFDPGRYRLAFEVWETAEEAPPVDLPEGSSSGQFEELPDTTRVPQVALYGSLAGVTVHNAEPGIRAGLLDRFGGSRSFLHADSWTLVFASVPGR